MGCWPLYGDLSVGEVVRWDAFEQPHRRERDYSGLGPFVFDAEQYLAAVADLVAGLARLNSAVDPPTASTM